MLSVSMWVHGWTFLKFFLFDFIVCASPSFYSSMYLIYLLSHHLASVCTHSTPQSSTRPFFFKGFTFLLSIQCLMLICGEASYLWNYYNCVVIFRLWCNIHTLDTAFPFVECVGSVNSRQNLRYVVQHCMSLNGAVTLVLIAPLNCWQNSNRSPPF